MFPEIWFNFCLTIRVNVIIGFLKKISTVFLFFILAQFSTLCILQAKPYESPEITTLAVKDIIEFAESGHPYYQGVLSILYRTGDRGMAVSLEKAREWAEKSSKGGSAIGTSTLGSLEMQKNNLLQANCQRLGNVACHQKTL